MAIHELRAKRATTFDAFAALAAKADFDPKKDQSEYDRLKAEVEGLDGQIKRAEEAQALARESAVAVPGQERATVPAAAETSPYVSEAVAKQMGYGSPKSLVLGGAVKMLAAGGGGILNARQMAKEVYGEAHPVTKTLVASVGASGGFFVPPDYIPDYIEILRAKARVRAAGPRVLPMPRGTMRLPAQTSAASASYGAEDKKIATSQQTTGALVATFKKLAGLVPISNDLLRYADPAIDAFVRDDLVKVMALREDLAFIQGDGTQDTPRGFLSFANANAVANGGTASAFLSTANSTLGSGGNFITANETYTETTVVADLGAAANALDVANVPDDKRVWFMHPRSRNYLYDLLNSLGVYVFRDELNKGTLRNYPVYTSTQIPTNLYDATGGNTDCSYVVLAEMTEAMLFDAMTLELAVSREGSYYDSNAVLQSAFQNDETLIRAIAEHDFLMRHDASVAVIQTVRWANSGSL
jgi:HK97 family phage major capsid protein